MSLDLIFFRVLRKRHSSPLRIMVEARVRCSTRHFLKKKKKKEKKYDAWDEMNRVSRTEVWNRVSMNGYCFINRSIGVPLDLRDSKIAFFMEETTNFPFLLPFFLFFSPKLNNAPHLCDLQLFNEQATKSRQPPLFFHGSF